MKYLAIRLIVAFSTFLIGLSATTLLVAPRFAVNSTGEAKQEILQVEHQYIQAHLNRDTATLDNILADEFTIGTRCRGTNKAQRLALLDDPDFAFESINTDNVEVNVNGDQAELTGDAILTGRYGDEEFTSPQYRFIRQYEKRQGRWQIVSVRVVR
jgi:ketosteroid isomerase-like protein